MSSRTESRKPVIRSATADDAAGVLSIYAPIVMDSPISFEIEPPTITEMQRRVEAGLRDHAFLVAEIDGALAGYAYAGSHRARPAYRYSVEVSVYVDQNHRGFGVARALYEQLFTELTSGGFCNAYAGITEPNPASTTLHLGLGFRKIGTFPRAGWKFGRWHDVSWYFRPLRERPPED